MSAMHGVLPDMASIIYSDVLFPLSATLQMRNIACGDYNVTMQWHPGELVTMVKDFIRLGYLPIQMKRHLMLSYFQQAQT